MLTATRHRNLPLAIKEPMDGYGCSIETILEIVWFFLALLLFVILGPFAAPAALIALFTYDHEGRADLPEPEELERSGW